MAEGSSAALYAQQLGSFLTLVVIQSVAMLLFKVCQVNGQYTFSPASSVALTELCKLGMAATLHQRERASSGRPYFEALSPKIVLHYLGLALFGREVVGAKDLPVWCSPRVADYLRGNGPWKQLVELGQIDVRAFQVGVPFAAWPGVTVQAGAPPPALPPASPAPPAGTRRTRRATPTLETPWRQLRAPPCSKRSFSASNACSVPPGQSPARRSFGRGPSHRGRFSASGGGPNKIW
mgnify:CR=1 FL=1